LGKGGYMTGQAAMMVGLWIYATTSTIIALAITLLVIKVKHG